MQLVFRAEKLTNERVAKGKFQKRKGFGFMFGQSFKKSRSSESLGNSSGSGAKSEAHPRYFDLFNHLDLVCHHLVLLPKVVLHQKDILVVVSLTLGLAMLHKCVFSVVRWAMLKGSARCLILLHQWGKL